MDPVRVFLVGAGPGDPGLITRRGLDLLQGCEVVLYDRLVAPDLVDEAPPSAERIFVGKSPGGTSMPQASIDALIVEKARAGKRVVRLKGGDPFVFGRGADEGQALAAAGIAFEIVPGISSALAAPAYAGISVTHGGLASSFAVLTGHETSPRPGSEERFAALAKGADTLVVLMGAASLGDIAARLIAAGRPGDEPAALVERASTPQQRSTVATLATLEGVARNVGVQAPVTVVVGPVVRMRDALDWFESRPLFGKRIVVTRPRVQAHDLVTRLEVLGAEVVAFPTIEIVDPPSFDEADRAIEVLAGGGYDWVMFTSVNTVERFFRRLRERGDARTFGRSRIAAVGPVTAEALRDRGIAPDLVPSIHTAAAMVDALGGGPGTVLAPRGVDAPSAILDDLGGAGWEIDAVPVYRTVVPPPAPAALEALQRGVDAVTFSSGSAVRGFLESATAFDLGATTVACIGPSTAQEAERLKIRVDVVAPEHTSESLVDSLVAALATGS